jgi:hypothetical protein
MTGDAGREHARTARQLARSAYLPGGSILWFDNEDPTGVVFTQPELDYYTEFFREITSTTGGLSAYRPGLYAHQSIAAQLLAIEPDLHVWEVEYDRDPNQATLPPLGAAVPGDNRFSLDASVRGVVLKSFQVATPAPPWNAWPLCRQFEGSNQGQIPRAAIGALTPLKNWDFNSSLVRDLTNHVATPRLATFAVGNTAFVARLDDLDPVYNAAGARQLPRRGRLRLYSSSSLNSPVELAPASGGSPEFLHPASPVAPLAGSIPEVVAVTTLTELLSATYLDGAWTTMQRLWSQDFGIRFPFAFDGCQVGQEKHLFYVGTSNILFSSRKRTDRAGQSWGDPAAAGGDLRLHPFGMVAACARANTVYVIAIDDQSRLVSLEWTLGSTTWPANTASVVSAPIIPSSVAIASPSTNVVVAVAIGTDMRPWGYVYQLANGGGSWSPGVAIGGTTDKILNHARLALTVIDQQTLDFIATGSDGSPQRYRLGLGSDWTATTRVALLNPPQADATPLFQPNPHGDISSVRSPTGRTTFAACCGVGAGATAALLSLVEGAAIRLLD